MVSFIPNRPVGINEIIFSMDNYAPKIRIGVCYWRCSLSWMKRLAQIEWPSNISNGAKHFSAEGIHGCIGKKLKKQSVFPYEHLLGSIESCSMNIKRLSLAIENFSDWASFRGQVAVLPRISQMLFVQFRMGKNALFTNILSMPLHFKQFSFLLTVASKTLIQESLKLW